MASGSTELMFSENYTLHKQLIIFENECNIFLTVPLIFTKTACLMRKVLALKIRFSL